MKNRKWKYCIYLFGLFLFLYFPNVNAQQKSLDKENVKLRSNTELANGFKLAVNSKNQVQILLNNKPLTDIVFDSVHVHFTNQAVFIGFKNNLCGLWGKDGRKILNTEFNYIKVIDFVSCKINNKHIKKYFYIGSKAKNGLVLFHEDGKQVINKINHYRSTIWINSEIADISFYNDSIEFYYNCETDQLNTSVNYETINLFMLGDSECEQAFINRYLSNNKYFHSLSKGQQLNYLTSSRFVNLAFGFKLKVNGAIEKKPVNFYFEQDGKVWWNQNTYVGGFVNHLEIFPYSNPGSEKYTELYYPFFGGFCPINLPYILDDFFQDYEKASSLQLFPLLIQDTLHSIDMINDLSQYRDRYYSGIVLHGEPGYFIGLWLAKGVNGYGLLDVFGNAKTEFDYDCFRILRRDKFYYEMHKGNKIDYFDINGIKCFELDGYLNRKLFNEEQAFEKGGEYFIMDTVRLALVPLPDKNYLIEEEYVGNYTENGLRFDERFIFHNNIDFLNNKQIFLASEKYYDFYWLLKDEQSKFGLVSTNGKILLPFEYDNIVFLDSFNNDANGIISIIASKKGKIILFDERLNRISDLLFDSVIPHSIGESNYDENIKLKFTIGNRSGAITYKNEIKYE